MSVQEVFLLDLYYCCPGCGAKFTAHELGSHYFDHRHTRRCCVRYSRNNCAWHWPYPFSMRGAFILGLDSAIEEIARGRAQLPPYAPLRRSGSIHRLFCEARARYMPEMRR